MTNMTLSETQHSISIQADPALLCLQDSTRLYNYEIRQVDLLTAEDEVQLARAMKQEKESVRPASKGKNKPTEESQQARNQLIESNLRLVVHIAKRYRGYGLDFMDLIQEGNIGLMHAVEKFDPSKGYRFSTYATWWIRQAISRALIEQGNGIRLPFYKIESMKKLSRIQQRLQSSCEGEEPTLEELATQMAITVKEVIELLTVDQNVMSLDRLYSNTNTNDENTLLDMLEDESQDTPEAVVFKQALESQVKELLSCLTPRESKVIQLRYGLNGYREHALKEIGQKLGISHEAVRQTEARALQKLNIPCLTQTLHDYLD